MMNRISLIDFAKKQAMEPLLEKEVQVRAYELYEQHGKRGAWVIAVGDFSRSIAHKSWPGTSGWRI
jgi:hypothetical protein